MSVVFLLFIMTLFFNFCTFCLVLFQFGCVIFFNDFLSFAGPFYLEVYFSKRGELS